MPAATFLATDDQMSTVGRNLNSRQDRRAGESLILW
jgi:hypothetical protein